MISEGTDSGCNLYSVTTGWMLFTCLLSFGGKDYEDHGTIFFYVRQRKVQHYINTVIEYGHFRLKIGGISRLTVLHYRNASQVPAVSYIVVNCRRSVSPLL